MERSFCAYNPTVEIDYDPAKNAKNLRERGLSFDKDNPEWTSGDFKRAVSFSGLPDSLQRKLRGPQRAPTKQRVTIRLSPDVVGRFKDSGPGWQTRMDAALQDWLKSHNPA
jgi:uncharacterized protein (DUF4415 family)